MTYKIEIKPSAEKQMRRLPADVLTSVVAKINGLRANARPHGAKKLAAGLGWRLRVGEYRIIYHVDDNEHVVTTAAVKSRQSAYS